MPERWSGRSRSLAPIPWRDSACALLGAAFCLRCQGFARSLSRRALGTDPGRRRCRSLPWAEMLRAFSAPEWAAERSRALLGGQPVVCGIWRGSRILAGIRLRERTRLGWECGHSVGWRRSDEPGGLTPRPAYGVLALSALLNGRRRGESNPKSANGQQPNRGKRTRGRDS